MIIKVEDNVAEQIAGRNIYNITTNGVENDCRPLVPAQRRTLHSLISDIEGYGEFSAREIWLKLHALLGVCSINEITVSQYSIAEKFLINEIEIAAEKATCNMLIHLILIEIDNRIDIKEKMNHYGTRQFGTSNLKQLNKIQLQNILNYIEELSNLQNLNNQSLFKQTKSLFKTNTRPTLAILLTGFILGAIVTHL